MYRQDQLLGGSCGLASHEFRTPASPPQWEASKLSRVPQGRQYWNRGLGQCTQSGRREPRAHFSAPRSVLLRPRKTGGALARKASALATLQDSCLTGAGVESGLFAAECVHYHSEHRKSFCPLIFSSQLSSAAMAPKIYIVPHCTPAVLNIWASCALSVLPCTPAGWN